MIRSLVVTNPRKKSIEMTLAYPEKSGFAIKSIDGLGPPKNNINTSYAYTIDGSVYNSSTTQNRNIVIDLILLPHPTIEYSRKQLYYIFERDTKIKMEIITDLDTYAITGYVESIEPNIFSDQESATISVICPNPWFESSKGLELCSNGVMPKFEFEFSNAAGTKSLIFGEVLANDYSVTYEGIDTGIDLDIIVKQKSSKIKIRFKNSETFDNNSESYIYKSLIINTSKLNDILGYDPSNASSGRTGQYVLKLCTVKGKKSLMFATHYPPDWPGATPSLPEYTNVFACVDMQSDWPYVAKGENSISIVEDSSNEPDISTKIVITPKYEGI